MTIEIMNKKAKHNLIDAKCRWWSDWLDGAVSFREQLSQTPPVPGAITHEICCLLSQCNCITYLWASQQILSAIRLISITKKTTFW